jgi:hypothetical protein
MGLKNIKIKSRVYLLFNGEKAEPQYFQDLKDHLKANNILVKYKKEFIKKSPWDFMDCAIKYKQEEILNGNLSIQDGDEIWCIFDIDNYFEENSTKFKRMIELAKKNDIKIAWSNECFEFWFLCHFALYQSAMPRFNYHKSLSRHFKNRKLGKYTKNMEGVFGKLLPFMEIAIKNAKKTFDGRLENNPSTAIHILVHKLLNNKDLK